MCSKLKFTWKFITFFSFVKVYGQNTVVADISVIHVTWIKVNTSCSCREMTINLFTTSESPNIWIPILQISVFIYWRGTRKHFSLVQKMFSTNKKCSPSISDYFHIPIIFDFLEFHCPFEVFSWNNFFSSH